MDPPDLKVALKREREEHQHLLAESYAAVMDLTKQVNTVDVQPVGKSSDFLYAAVGRFGYLIYSLLTLQQLGLLIC